MRVYVVSRVFIPKLPDLSVGAGQATYKKRVFAVLVGIFQWQNRLPGHRLPTKIEKIAF